MTHACKILLAIIWWLCIPGQVFVIAQSFTPSFRFKSITVNEKLSHSDVTCIIQDNTGYIWVGTNNGLNRFDGYDLETFKYDLETPHSLPGNRIKAMELDHLGHIWISIENKGVFRFHPKEMLYKMIDIPYPTIKVTDIQQGPGNDIWLQKEGVGLIRVLLQENGTATQFIPYPSSLITGQEDGSQVLHMHANEESVYLVTRKSDLWTFDIRQERFHKVIERDQFSLDAEERLRCVYEKDNILWFGSNQGRLMSLEKEAGGSIRHRIQLKEHFPNDYDRQYAITKILEDSNDRLWLGTNAGLYLLGAEDGLKSVFQYKYSHELGSSISSNQVRDLCEDRFGILWIGTDGGGLDYTNLRRKAFGQIPLPTSEPLSENNVVTAIYKNRSNKVWIGTRSGLYIYNLVIQQYEMNQDGQIDFLNLNTVFLYEDPQGIIWIGTGSDGLYWAIEKDGQIEIQRWRDQNGERPADMVKTMQIAEDKQGRLWVSTYLEGLFIIDALRERVERLQYDAINPNSLSSNKLTDVYCDPLDGSIWVSTRDQGVNHISNVAEDNWQIQHYAYDAQSGTSISSNHCWQILRSNTGDLWIATLGGGINKAYKDETGEYKFQRYTIKDGLLDNDIECFEEDADGQLWLAGVGLTKLYPNTGEVEQYDYQDGLQSNSFKTGANFKDEQGVLYFGGIKGVNYFRPGLIQSDTILPVVQLTGLSINDQKVDIGTELHGRVLLEHHLSDTQRISLKANENNCSINFVGLQFAAPEKNQYQYQLEGLNDNWISTQYPNLSARYYNIPPGDYLFKIRASNGDGVWNRAVTSLAIHIANPWYKTIWAYLSYVLISVLALVLFNQNTIRQTRLKNDLVLAEKDRELNQTKLHFFTQISHELRTPLTLIKIPLDDLLLRSDLKRHTQEKLAVIQSSVGRLLGLVNQLLEFRKMETGNVQLQAATGNFVKFAREVFLIFSQSASDKGIHFDFDCPVDNLQLCFDRDKMEIVLMNLLHNAYKYTPEEGMIHIRISYQGSDQAVGQYDSGKLVNNFLQLEVIDNGPGLGKAEREKIFMPYYQVSGSDANQANTLAGTGIGLSLVKSITTLHEGTVVVESQLGVGATFRVCLP
ncbi:MAG: hypothetical protein KTR30_03650, partial [Saprospiraceae bacterium]|nr:hypothetical protein [Saprospiraceae bacterium]